MKPPILILSVLLTCLFALPSFAQELQGDNPKEKHPFSSNVHLNFAEAIEHTQRWWDIVKRESLKSTSNRDLRFRCGRYWVDFYDKLIAPNDREIGIWGVDAPAPMHLPITPMRR